MAYDRHRDELLRIAGEKALTQSPRRWAEYARFVQEKAFDALSNRQLDDETLRELRLLLSDAVRMEREAFQFELVRGSGDTERGIREFLKAVSPSPSEVAELFDDSEGA
jgi:hypothetical protein